MKALITGISGFAGSHLAEQLLKEEIEVCGTYLNEGSLNNLSEVSDRLNLIKVNLLEENKISEIFNSQKPDYVFHLAALTSPKDSFDSPRETFVNNVSGQINVLEAIRKNNLAETKILIVSSAEIYGLVSKDNLPIDEETPFAPTNPYAVSKLAQDFLGLQYYLSNKLKIVRVRPFNHIGKRQSPSFVVSSFAKKIAEIEKGKEKTLTVGNLETKRDFTDVRDMVKAYLLALKLGKEGEVYNIGSGKSYEIREILEKLIKLSGSKIEIAEDKALLRPSDNPELVCDYSKFHNLTGWKPEISIDESLKDILDYWRNII